MPRKVRIALDAMGGDHGAAVVVPGAELSLGRHPDIEFLLFGDRAAVTPLLDSRPRLDHIGLPDPMIVAVPLGFHAFVIFAGIATGIFRQQPVLALIALLMLILSIGIHLLPWWLARSRLNAADTR